MFKLVIFGFTCFATCSHLIMSIYHWTNSSFSMCEKKNIQKEKDGMNWRVLRLSKCLLFNIHIGVDEGDARY